MPVYARVSLHVCVNVYMFMCDVQMRERGRERESTPTLGFPGASLPPVLLDFCLLGKSAVLPLAVVWETLQENP